ncbi:MAG: Crp/Fnr family transcriptional regulator [Selenomonadales bacterium]|nr:Crp/Fnr family transcriptional regulator [Selenomonadales bacterium]
MSLPFNATYYIDVPRDEKAEKLILQYGVRKKLKAGEFLIRAGEAVTTINYLLSGALTHFAISEQGTEKVGYINHPGSFTNELLFLVHGGYLIPKRFVAVRQDSEVLVIDSQCFNILNQYREFQSILMRSLNQKYSILRAEVDSFAFNSAQTRLFRLFIASVNRDSLSREKEWIPLKVTYTQQEMGAIIGIHRVSIARLLNNLCNGGYIRQVNHKIEVNKKYVDAGK